MSACRMRIFLLVGLCGLVFEVSAQNRPLNDAELNRLTTWYSTYQPQTPQEKQVMGKYASPTVYETIAELADRAAKKDLVQALQINTAVLSRANVERLGLDGDDIFSKVSKLKKRVNLTLYRCNLERIPAMDWKNFPVFELSLMRNRLAEVPAELLESPKLERVGLVENLLPKPLNTNFGSKEALRLVMGEAGLLTLDKLAKPNRGIAAAYVQMAFQKAG